MSVRPPSRPRHTLSWTPFVLRPDPAPVPSAAADATAEPATGLPNGRGRLLVGVVGGWGRRAGGLVEVHDHGVKPVRLGQGAAGPGELLAVPVVG